MNAITAPKSHRLNLIEGMTLTAIFQAIPTCAGAVLLLKLVGSSQIVGYTDATLPFCDKLFRWRTQPTTSLQLVTIVMMLSLLAVGVVSVE